jgi:hypothetical protein
MSTVKLNDHSDDGTVARHREGTELVRECRWVFEPIAARPREADRDIGRIVQIDAWIGAVAQRDGAAQDLTGPALRAGTAVVEEDLRPRAGHAELARPLGQDAARVGLEPAGGLRQRRAAGAAGAEHENESADLPDPHRGTLAGTGAELRRHAQGD